MAAALLAIDCQVFFAAELKKSLPNILALVRAFSGVKLKQDFLVVFTQHGHTTDEISGEVPNQIVKRWGPENSIHIGSPEWEFLPELEGVRTKGVHVSAKNSYDAFINSDLEAWIRKEKVERVVVCGCLTDFCCETTAKSAFCRGFETWFVEDACGTGTAKQHAEGVNGFEKLCGTAMKTNEVLKWVENVVDDCEGPVMA